MRVALLALLAGFVILAADAPPRSWIDPDTGHRVVRLTDEPGSASLYFNQNGYTQDGKHLVSTTPHGISLLEVVSGKARQIVEGSVRLIDAGRRYPRVYYTKGTAVYLTDYASNETRKIAEPPERGGIATVNADETMLGGTYTEAPLPASAQPLGCAGHPLDQPLNKGQMMENPLPRAFQWRCLRSTSRLASARSCTGQPTG